VTADVRDPDALGQALLRVKQAIGIPRTLAEAGVKEEHLPRLLEIGVADVCHANNPKAVTSNDFRALFAAALNGT